MAEIVALDRAVVRVSGADAEKLLNDTLTGELGGGPDGSGRWLALLTPQGKIVAEGLMTGRRDAFWFDLPPVGRDEFVKRMRLYKLRAAVDIEDLGDEWRVGWSAEPPAGPADALAFRDPRHPTLGFRVIAPATEAQGWAAETGALAARRLGLGIAELGSEFGPDERFPHDIGMDQLAGVDFEKGCFIGQEVVSRMQRRGTARRRPVLVISGEPLARGTEIVCGGLKVGEVAGSAGELALAIVRIDRVDDPAACTADGRPVRLELPEWAGYGFSAAEAGDSSARGS